MKTFSVTSGTCKARQLPFVALACLILAACTSTTSEVLDVSQTAASGTQSAPTQLVSTPSVERKALDSGNASAQVATANTTQDLLATEANKVSKAETQSAQLPDATNTYAPSEDTSQHPAALGQASRTGAFPKLGYAPKAQTEQFSKTEAKSLRADMNKTVDQMSSRQARDAKKQYEREIKAMRALLKKQRKLQKSQDE